MALPLAGLLAGGARLLPYLATVGAFLPMLGGPKGAATRAAAKNAIQGVPGNRLMGLAKQLGVSTKGKKQAKIREEILEQMIKQEMPSNTRLGTIAGTGRASAYTRGGLIAGGVVGGLNTLMGDEGVGGAGNPTQEELLGLTMPGIDDQFGLMEQDIARLNMAEHAGRALDSRLQGIESELQQLLSPADLYSISSAAAADQLAQQGLGTSLQGMAGVPRV